MAGVLAPVVAQAQDVQELSTEVAATPNVVEFRFGYVNYSTVLTAVPDYAQMESDMAALTAQFAAEQAASDEEFNDKFETYLNECSTYAPAILRKRQAELKEAMHRNEQFRAETERLLEQARADMMSELRAKIDATISQLALANQLAFVLNTDSEAVPFLNASMGYNLTEAVIAALQ